MQTPLVSIIIPTYNRAHLIGETLDSVIAQTYTNWECIVVDDGSTDTTDEVLKAYCDKEDRIKYYHRPENRPKGANACRNYGFELSKGEYVNWFDSDDLMLSDKLMVQVNELHNSSYDYTICQTMMFDVATNKEIGLRAQKLTSENLIDEYLLFKTFWLIEAPLWKKKFLKESHSTFDEELQQAQDYDYHFRILLKSKNYLTNNKPMVIVKCHDNNMSLSTTDSKEKIISNIKVKIKIVNNSKENLSKNVQLKFYNDLFELFKKHTRNKQFNYSKIIMKCLVKNCDILPYNFFEKIYFIGRLNLGLLSYSLLSRGYKILKFDL